MRHSVTAALRAQLALMAVLAMGGARAQLTDVPATPLAYEPGAARQVGPVHIVPIRGGVYMIATPDGNSTVQIGDEGVVVVDTVSASLAPSLVEAIRALSSRAVVQIINTNVDRAGGNQIVRNAGVATPDLSAANLAFQAGAAEGAPILAFDTVLYRMSGMSDDGSMPSAMWPTSTYFVERIDLFINGEPIQIMHAPAAYSDSDSLVLFRRSDVVSTGDVFTPHRYPRMDLENGGSLNGIVAALNRILELTVPEVKQEGGTMVVPAEGRLCDEADVAEYRDMVSIVRGRIQDMVSQGMTLEQVKEARPTRDYDVLYSTPDYSGETFVEAAYRSLSGASNP